MKIPSLILPAAVAIVTFAACEQESRPVKPKPPVSEDSDSTKPKATPTPEADSSEDETESTSESTQDPSGTPTPAPSPSATTVSDIPYGNPVPGKSGFVTSPFSDAGYVDVRGFPPNTEVKDPYSGKIFRVP